MTLLHRLARQSGRIQKAFWLAKLRAACATGSPPALHRVLGSIGDDLWLWMNTDGYRRYSVIRECLPGIADEATQHVFNGRSGDANLKHAFTAYRLFKRAAERVNGPFDERTTVLDFGCGWGRIIRFFLRDVPASNLLGVDCMPKAIELCRQLNRSARFLQTPTLPPTDLPDRGFDLIYLNSVFSHLPEEAHDRWLNEFRRLLKPGGVLVATTFSRGFIEECERVRRGERDGRRSMHNAFDPASEWLGRYDRGEFCYSGTYEGDHLDRNLFGLTCIPADYVKAHWTDRFRFVDFIPAEGSGLGQDTIVAQKPR